MSSANGTSTGPSPLKGKSILILGAGTFGVSTAYHLAHKLDLAATGTSVTVLDRFPCPSENAATNDLNKVIRSDYSEPIYSRLAVEAMKEWTSPTGTVSGMFKQTGWFLVAENVSIPFIESSVENQKKLGREGARKVSTEEARQLSRAYNGTMDNWQIWWNPAAGWATSGDALSAMARAAIARGVKFVSGDQGWARKLQYNSQGDCTGVITADGTRHTADMVILSAGAASPELLDFHGQLEAKGHVVGHIQLTPEEAKRYATMPIMDHLEKGIVFPPNRDGIVKVATVKFVTNFNNSKYPGLSMPRYRSDNPKDGVPQIIEQEIRDFVREFLPDLADKPWAETRICWDTESKDLHFIVDKHPQHNGLFLATAGSAHGMKFLPIIGKYVVQMLEAKLEPDLAHSWAWRPNRPRPTKQGPDPHPYPSRELSDFPDFAPRPISSKL